MNREKIQTAIKAIESRLAANSPLQTQLASLKALEQQQHFSLDSAKILVEKIMQQSPKKLRGVLYNMLVSREQRMEGWERHRNSKNEIAGSAVTNIGAPYQGGAPGLGKGS